MQQLSKKTITKIATANIDLPNAHYFNLPEKVLQFGTGILLRGLPDYFIDKANKQGVFNGRIVVVKSTESGDATAFENQDYLYTQCIEAAEAGKKVEKMMVNASISRVLSANNEWNAVLKCAENPNIEIILSNTTEVGIVLMNDDHVHAAPPSSFPGKLLSFLYHRFRFFNGDASKGMVIIPTELIPDNASTLLSILLELAHQGGFETSFIDWLENANDFCNSLVDRIVPGKLPEQEHKQFEKLLGYKDELMIMSESYALWAIETSSKRTKQLLSFEAVDSSVVLAPSISVYRQLKLRLLNGTHTFSCAVAFLSGFKTVHEAMSNSNFNKFIEQLMFQEIVPVINSSSISFQNANNFASSVLTRFRNPYIKHKWLTIAMQFTAKMRMRNVDMLMKANKKFGEVPPAMVLGFAAYLLFMKSSRNENGNYYGNFKNETYQINDQHAKQLHTYWQLNHADMVQQLLKDEQLWGEDLTTINGFEKSITEMMEMIQNNGVEKCLQSFDVETV